MALAKFFSLLFCLHVVHHYTVPCALQNRYKFKLHLYHADRSAVLLMVDGFFL